MDHLRGLPTSPTGTSSSHPLIHSPYVHVQQQPHYVMDDALDEDSDGEFIKPKLRVRARPHPHMPHLTTTGIFATILLSMAALLVLVVVSVPPQRREGVVLGGGSGAEALLAATAADSNAQSSSMASHPGSHGTGTSTQLAVHSRTEGLPPFDPHATRQRAQAAVVGALVADAATMGLHWCVPADRHRHVGDRARMPAAAHCCQ